MACNLQTNESFRPTRVVWLEGGGSFGVGVEYIWFATEAKVKKTVNILWIDGLSCLFGNSQK